MSKNRQSSPHAEDSLIVRSLALRLPAGARISEHDHPWHQVIFAVRGVMAVEATARRWVVPPQRALWVPTGVPHGIEMIGETWMRTVYIRPWFGPAMDERIRVLEVRPLLRELLLEVVRVGMLGEGGTDERDLAAVLVAQIGAASAFGIELPLPLDSRARAVADEVCRRPGASVPLDSLAAAAGAGARTVERLFLNETGLSFGRWRQQARLQHALRRLAEGDGVTQVALQCGYESPSAFVLMFRRALGFTPGEYRRNSAGRNHRSDHPHGASDRSRGEGGELT